MAKKLGYKMKKNSDCMPGSLKKEHDRAVVSWNAPQKQMAYERFCRAAADNKKYEMTGNGFLVMVPKKPEEIIAEGVAQNHCVGIYVEKVTEGRSVICFVRKKACPDFSYFTMEIVNGEITQLRGFGNKLPDDPGLKKFIVEYAGKKKLKISCPL